MHSIKERQVRCLRTAVRNGKIYSTAKSIGYLLENPLGKTVEEIKFNKPTRKQVMYGMVVETKGSTFIEHTIDFGHTSSFMYVITKDDKVIYFTFSPVYAPASAAFHTLTEVYMNASDGQWKFESLNDCKVYDHKENIFTKVTGKQRHYETIKLNDVTHRLNKITPYHFS